VGRSIEFSGTGTTAGLISLVSGDSDVAMLSAPLDDVARAINSKTPGRVDTSVLHAIQIGEARTVFIVNPRNHVRSLTTEQLTGVLTGKVTNWKEVGGADASIHVVSLANGGPLLEHLLRGQAITSASHGVPNATQIPVFVSQDPDAIGIISAAHARGQTSLIQTDALVFAPLFLVTKGEPSGATRKLVETARTLLGSSG
jgi:phosphate transport system substrate-binding protein